MERCAECGFDYDLNQAENTGATIVGGVSDFVSILVGHDTAALRSRRHHAVWSPLEYGCHVRDLLLVQRERVLLARRRQLPSFEPMGRVERVDHDGYAEQDPLEVAGQLDMAARMFARDVDRLGPADWERRVIYNYPEKTERTLRWVAVHTAHEVRHHLLDARRQFT